MPEEISREKRGDMLETCKNSFMLMTIHGTFDRELV